MTELELIDRHHGPRMVRLTRAGARLCREFGPLAGPWRESEREFSNEQQAERALAHAVEKLIIDGYEIGAHNPELIAQIAGAPDELRNYLVYADWLLDHDDPRGELIQLMVALEQRPEDAELQRSISHLQAQHRLRFERWSWSGLKLRWRWGFVEALLIEGWLTLNPNAMHLYPQWPKQQLFGLRNHPSGRFVRRLLADERRYEVGFDDAAPVSHRVLLRPLATS